MSHDSNYIIGIFAQLFKAVPIFCDIITYRSFISGKANKSEYFPQISVKLVDIFKTSDLQNMKTIVVKQIFQHFRNIIEINKRIKVLCTIPCFLTVVQNNGKNSV